MTGSAWPRTLLAGACLAVAAASVTAAAVGGEGSPAGFRHFITRRGDDLLDGEEPFRFVGMNMPGLVMPADTYRAVDPARAVLPTPWEQEDGMKSLAQMGMRCVRTWNLPVRRPDEDRAGSWCSVLGPGEFNEKALRCLDRVLALAGRYGIRVIVTLCNGGRGSGHGVSAYLAHRGREGRPGAFYTDPRLIDDFKATVRHVLERTNTVTGVPYKEEKAVLAWQPGSAMGPPGLPEADYWRWEGAIAAFIKSVAPNHLVASAAGYRPLRLPAGGPDPHVDIYDHHLAGGDWPRAVRYACDLTRDRRPCMVGEFDAGASPAAAGRGVGPMLDAVIETGTAGALGWVMTFHRRDGGFWWYTRDTVGLVWPGGPVGRQRETCWSLRAKAFAVAGRPVPPLPPVDPPVLLPVASPPVLNWRGASGAEGYDVQRAASPTGPWQTVAANVWDGRTPHGPLFSDLTAPADEAAWYRVVARSGTLRSAPSNVVGPVRADRLRLVDELADFRYVHDRSPGLAVANRFAHSHAKRFYRVRGMPGDRLVYRVPSKIVSFEVLGWSPATVPDFRVRVSPDGRRYTPVETTVTPRLVGPIPGRPAEVALREVRVAGRPAGGPRYLEIRFAGCADLDRVEVDFRPRPKGATGPADPAPPDGPAEPPRAAPAGTAGRLRASLVGALVIPPDPDHRFPVVNPAGGYVTGTRAVIEVTDPGGRLLGLDREASRAVAMEDDRGTDLLSPFRTAGAEGRRRPVRLGPLHRVLEGGRRLRVAVESPVPPAASAGRVAVEASLSVRLGTEPATGESEPTPLREGGRLLVWPFAFRVLEVAPGWGGTAVTVTLQSRRPLRTLEGLSFCDGRGAPLRSVDLGRRGGEHDYRLTVGLARSVESIVARARYAARTWSERVAVRGTVRLQRPDVPERDRP